MPIDELLELRSTATALSMRKIHDRLQAVVNILESLKVNKDNYAVVLVPMIRCILPRANKTDWARLELSQSSGINSGADRLTHF